jgi:catechol 2,3-dioxygenase
MAAKIDPATSLGEVKLKVSNLDRSIEFYRDVVGLQVEVRQGNIARLGAGEDRTLLVLEQVTDAIVTPQRRFSGLYHFAILLPTRVALGVALRRLVASGIRIGQADHLVSEALYISDPEQNGIEIYRDRPRDEWEHDDRGQVKMASDPIDWEGLLALADGQAETAMPTGTIIGHVHLHVGNLAESERFYCGVLGFDMMADYLRPAGALFVSAGGYHHHLGLNTWQGAGAPLPPPNGTGLAWYTIELPDADALAAVIERLKSAGAPVSATEGKDDGKGGCWMASDPTGIAIRLVVRRSGR